MARKIRVAHIIPRYYPIFGGAETQCRSLIRHLLATDEVEVPFVVTGRVESNYARMEQIDEVTVYRLGAPGIGRWHWYRFYLASSWFLIRHRKAFDLIHCHATSVMGFAMTITGRLIRKPVILKLSTNGELLPSAGAVSPPARTSWLRSRLGVTMARYIARRATIVALNREGSKEAEAAAPGKSVTIPNGIDLTQYCPLDPEARSAQRAKFGFGPNDIVLLFVGRFVVGKGIDVLLAAFELLNSEARSERLHLCLAGGGRLQVDAVEGLDALDARGLNPRIHILPPIIPATEYYQLADIFVFPSQREGLPNVVLEALAVGLPCVLSDIEPHLELMETNPGADVCIFKTDDAEQLVTAIRTQLDARDSASPSRIARACLSEDYQIESVTRKYVSLYSRLYSANQKRALGNT